METRDNEYCKSIYCTFNMGPDGTWILQKHDNKSVKPY